MSWLFPLNFVLPVKRINSFKYIVAFSSSQTTWYESKVYFAINFFIHKTEI